MKIIKNFLLHTTNASWFGAFCSCIITGRSPGSQIIAYPAAFPVSQWRFSRPLPAYGDEIAQDLHLLPFSPIQTAFRLD